MSLSSLEDMEYPSLIVVPILFMLAFASHFFVGLHYGDDIVPLTLFTSLTLGYVVLEAALVVFIFNVLFARFYAEPDSFSRPFGILLSVLLFVEAIKAAMDFLIPGFNGISVASNGYMYGQLIMVVVYAIIVATVHLFGMIAAYGECIREIGWFKTLVILIVAPILVSVVKYLGTLAFHLVVF